MILDPYLLTGVLLVCAFAAGFVDSVAGGGGLIQVPALFTLNPQVPAANLLAINKVASIGGTLTAAKRYLKYVKLPYLLLSFAILFAFGGSFMGAWVVTQLPSGAFRLILPPTLLLLLLYTLRSPALGEVHDPRPMSIFEGVKASLLGLAVGFYDGFFGPGTGTFLLIGFVRIFGFDFLHASAAAKMVNVSTNLAAILMFGFLGHVDWTMGVYMMAANILGSLIGTYFAVKHGNYFVKRLFVLVVSALILKTSFDAWRELLN